MSDDRSMFGFDHDGDGVVSEEDDFLSFVILTEEERIAQEERARREKETPRQYPPPTASYGGSDMSLTDMLNSAFVVFGLIGILCMPILIIEFTDFHAAWPSWLMLLLWWGGAIALARFMPLRFALTADVLWCSVLVMLTTARAITDLGRYYHSLSEFDRKWEYKDGIETEYMRMTLCIVLSAAAVLFLCRLIRNKRRENTVNG